MACKTRTRFPFRRIERGMGLDNKQTEHCCDRDAACERTPTGAAVGIDMGVVATATTSDGAHLAIPALLSPGETQCKRRLQRKLARQKKGSNRRARTKHQTEALRETWRPDDRTWADKEFRRDKIWLRSGSRYARTDIVQPDINSKGGL